MFAVVVAASAAAGCQVSKSSNPLSPSVAGPIAGVTITQPNLLEPGMDWQIRLRDQPVRLMIQNADTSGQRPLTYAFEIASDDIFTNIVFKRTGVVPGDGTTTLQLPDALPTGRTYWWRARAEDGANNGSYSTAVRFNAITPVELGAPSPVSPSGTVTTTTPEFKVNAGSKSGPAERIVYTIQVANDQAFSQQIALFLPDESGSETTVNQNYSFLNNHTYYWRVQARDTGDSQALSPWSNTQAFTTNVPPPPPPPPPSGGGGGAPSGNGDWQSCGSTPGDTLVQCVRAAVYRNSTIDDAFAVTKRVAWLLRGSGAGLLTKPGGENIITWQGHSLSISRICYPNGGIVKVLTDAGPGGGNGATWDTSLNYPGSVSPSLYVPAINPGLP